MWRWNWKKNRLCLDFVSVQPLFRNLIGCQLKVAYSSQIWLDQTFQAVRTNELFGYGNLDLLAKRYRKSIISSSRKTIEKDDQTRRQCLAKEENQRVAKLELKPQRHDQAELVCSSPLDESNEASAKETTLGELELVPQSTLQLCWITWLLKTWSWQETLPETITKRESVPDTCSWPSETTKSWTSCSKEWPLLKVVCCPTSKQFCCPRSNLLLKTKPSKWARCDAAIAETCNINKTRTSLSLSKPGLFKGHHFFHNFKVQFQLTHWCWILPLVYLVKWAHRKSFNWSRGEYSMELIIQQLFRAQQFRSFKTIR